MWKNYIRVAWRNLAKGRLYSLINIFGLSAGAAVCILIMLYVTNEWSYDRFHTRSERTYRMWVKEHFRGDIFFNTVTPLAMGEALRDNFPGRKSGPICLRQCGPAAGQFYGPGSGALCRSGIS
ncbi:MAG: ABC transporter permease [Lewinellaceae bacterium]|nr:ABC transporter permease [Lewinellaceae bacterium]